MTDILYKNPSKSAYLIILFLAFTSTIYNAYLSIHGDEAYYWMWSHDLHTGYYDHPPMIAYMIYFTNFISEDVWGVRLVNIFSMSITSFYIFKLTKLLSDEKTALNAVIIFSSVLLTHAGYIFATPDTPLNLFWTLSLYYSYKAIFEGKLQDYILTGLFLGLMMISKYSSILLVAAIVIFMLTKRRELFLEPKMYLSIAISLVMITPMLYWNYQNDWISFLFQIDHGSSDDFHIQPWLILEFISAQFGVYTPVFAWILFFYLIKDRLYFRDEKLYFVALSVSVILLFFLYKSFYVSMAPNYGAPAYIGGTVLLAIIFSKYELKKSFKVGLIIALFFTILVRIAMITHLDELQRFMYKTQEVVKQFSTHMREGDKIYGAHLTTAAYLKFYLPNHPDTDVGIPSRYSYYDMVRGDDYLQDGLVLCRNNKRDKLLKQNFKNVELIDTYVVIPDKRVFYTYRVSEPIKKSTK
ncbi:dolichyl-phosphate-mannose--protein mannosyltransferase [Sulfurimonas aquatica]|uniref:Dolichyl-phosphate-mannose--protein mannosyltransferase n=1 Tax=Sulfurimonas aquatica TaxID=2672570 RepID=A0A975B045_9BACT|nr:glycosyltransferase family 39 protein [Sulfurimonas aquatica]QSZ41685.1 dolichyl-phosphate-mannose--protein mannosyltransferase [Sulfurimonas aquatica]